MVGNTCLLSRCSLYLTHMFKTAFCICLISNKTSLWLRKNSGLLHTNGVLAHSTFVYKCFFQNVKFNTLSLFIQYAGEHSLKKRKPPKKARRIANENRFPRKAIGNWSWYSPLWQNVESAVPWPETTQGQWGALQLPSLTRVPSAENQGDIFPRLLGKNL